MDCSMPAFPLHHQLPELSQTHVHQVADAIQELHSLVFRAIFRTAAQLLSWASHRSHPWNFPSLELDSWVLHLMSTFVSCLLYFFGYALWLLHQVKGMTASEAWEQALSWDLPSASSWRATCLPSGWTSSFLHPESPFLISFPCFAFYSNFQRKQLMVNKFFKT